MAVVGCFFAFILGLIFGVMGISKNEAVKGFSASYVNIIRNIPLLLQLFFWYALFTDIFPSVRQANSTFGLIFSNRGFYFPVFEERSVMVIWFISCVSVAFLSTYIHLTKIKTYRFYKWLISTLAITGIFTVAFSLSFDLSKPILKGFNIEGGKYLSPEFCSLFLGLTIYTGAFMAEIIRAGILAIPKGQWEAARSLGLSEFNVLRFVIIPQSFRVSFPPLISQFLNLTKNSSLAVAIGYPDFVSIANTSMNQTGQAIELVALIMLVYLSVSLSSSLILNLFSKRFVGHE